MDRRVEDVVAFFEEMLGAVPVMHVPVEDEYPLDSFLLAQVLGDTGQRVEKAETHGPLFLGMMSRRPGDDQGAFTAVLHPDILGRCQRGADGSARRSVRTAGDRIVQ